MTLKELRTARGLTLEQLAKHIECNCTTLCKYETGESTISKRYYDKLCLFFNVTSIEPQCYKFRFNKAEIETIKQALCEFNKALGQELLSGCNYDLNKALELYNEAVSVQLYKSMKGVFSNE